MIMYNNNPQSACLDYNAYIQDSEYANNNSLIQATQIK